MSDIAIRVENLGKMYRIGAKQERYGRFTETAMDAVTAPFRRLSSIVRNPSSIVHRPPSADDTIWALRDVCFEVERGEVVGIIGRNGAGKSTLLKILSRITEPTTGRVELHGRVGSLLEVGTGFHPELTGQENVYLNGAILGMKKAEIDRRFDGIVAFAEIERFLDTPVKRYSSGMYVRLAFAVAAHLEPEILLVDEVLAVGDAAFQKKCLGKMGEIAKEGRTVLFVSHSMRAIQSLCSRAFQLEAGQVAASGAPQSVVAGYLAATSRVGSEVVWSEDSAPGNDEIRLIGLRVCSENVGGGGVYSSKEDIHVEVDFLANTSHSALCIGFDLISAEGVVVTRSYHTDLAAENWPPIRIGENRWRCVIPSGLLNAGVYYVCPRIGMHSMYWIVNLDAVVQFEVVLDHGVSPFWNVLDGHNRPGVIAPILGWRSQIGE